MSKPVKGIYRFGPFLLNRDERLLLRHGKQVELHPTAFELLFVLVEHSGHLFEKKELMEAVWPDRFVGDNNLHVNINYLRATLCDHFQEPCYIETVRGHGYRFIAKVRRLPDDEIEKEIEPVGGAVPLNSKYYIERPTDAEFRSAIARRDSIVLVKGPRQVGKTSLLARGLQAARSGEAKIILTDFQELNTADLDSVGQLLLTLATSMIHQLNLDVPPARMPNPQFSPSSDFERFLLREVFAQVSSPVVWGLDEVDRLFDRDYRNDIFGLFRAWHNKRALDPEGPWHRLTLAIAYATEAHLFITDLNQSPFNVGTRLQLDDFTLAQVTELNERYESPLHEPQEVMRYFELLGGQPYLVQRGLYEMFARRCSFADLEAHADHGEGVFGDHLRRLFDALTRDDELRDAVRGMLRGGPCPTPKSFYRLRSAGVLAGDSASNARLRCQLYATYLEKRLF